MFGNDIRKLGSPDPAVRRAAAARLGERRSPGAIEPLVSTLLWDDVEEVRKAAGRALRAFGDPEILRDLAASAAGQLGEHDSLARRRGYAAVDALRFLGDPQALPLLAATALDQDHPLAAGAREAWRCLCRSREEGWVETTNALLPDLAGETTGGPDHRRAAAMELLADVADPGAFDLFVVDLSDPSDGVRAAAARGLGELGDARAVEPLCAAVPDDPARSLTLRAVVAGLVRFAGVDPRARDALVKVLGATDDQAREAARTALERLGWSPSMPREQALWFHATDAVGELAAVRDPLVNDLLASMAEGNASDGIAVGPWITDLGTEASRILAERGDPRGVEVLLGIASNRKTDASGSPFAGEREARAMGLLARCGGERGHEYVARVFDDGDIAAVEPLLLTGRRGRERVVAALRDGKPAQQREAARALREHGWQPADAGERALLAVIDWRFPDASAEGVAAIEPLLRFLGDRETIAAEPGGTVELERAAGALTAILERSAIEADSALLTRVANELDDTLHFSYSEIVDRCFHERRDGVIDAGPIRQLACRELRRRGLMV